MKPRLPVTTRTQVLLHLWHVARSILCGILGIAITKPINPIKRSTITERETLRRQLPNDGMILCAIAPFKEIQIQSAPETNAETMHARLCSRSRAWLGASVVATPRGLKLEKVYEMRLKQRMRRVNMER